MNHNDVYTDTDNMSAKVATQTPPVSMELQRLEKANAELLNLVNALESRIVFILSGPGPNPSQQEEKISASSPLVSLLHQRITEVESLCYRLSSILRRLEI